MGLLELLCVDVKRNACEEKCIKPLCNHYSCILPDRKFLLAPEVLSQLSLEQFCCLSLYFYYLCIVPKLYSSFLSILNCIYLYR